MDKLSDGRCFIWENTEESEIFKVAFTRTHKSKKNYLHKSLRMVIED